ncbi:MAG: P-II family nitrogen regulator [Thermodesulfobacteriota bacterium]
MKEIKAYIKKHKLAPVTLALHKIEGLTGISVTDVRGFGRGRAKDQPHRVVDDLIDYVTGVKLEIVCRDDLVDEVIRTIQQTAHTGLKGDGKIYVSDVEQAVRISTGERGEGAV